MVVLRVARQMLGLRALRMSEFKSVTLPMQTVMFIDLKNFTSICSHSNATDVGNWIASFYNEVDDLAYEHGIRVAERRGDCCICLTDENRGRRSVSRMLSFAIDAHDHLLDLECARGDSSDKNLRRPTLCRMGIATGDVAMVCSDDDRFVTVQGDVVNVASRLEALAGADTVLVHNSAISFLADGSPVNTVSMEIKGKGMEECAVFSLTRGVGWSPKKNYRKKRFVYWARRYLCCCCCR